MLFAVVDFVSSDMENVAQKCSLSYKVKGTAPKSWYINQRAQSCLAHGQGWAYLGGPSAADIGPGLAESHFQTSLCPQALVAVRRVLLAQFSAFPANGADLYEELKSSTAILPTGSPRWVHLPPALPRAVLASTGFEFQSPNHPHALVCIWERDLRHKYLGTAASQCPPIVAEGVLIIPPCVHPKAWTSCWTRGCTRGK